MVSICHEFPKFQAKPRIFENYFLSFEVSDAYVKIFYLEKLWKKWIEEYWSLFPVELYFTPVLY